jgi:hypothetical protein
MRSRLSALVLSAALSSTLLAGCSDDGDVSRPEEDSPSSVAGSTTERDDEGVLDDGSGDKQRNCEVSVEVTGSSDGSWAGKGQSVQPASGSPSAYYTAEDGKSVVQVFAAGGEIEESSAVVTLDGTSFTTDPAGDAGVRAGEDGLTAEVDAVATSSGGDEVDVVAEFTCGDAKQKERKQSKG